MARKSGLGKGLDALIPTGDSALPASGINEIPVHQIVPNPKQPRTKFDETELSELADSIREHGIIQPLIVTRSDQPSEYILIAGERRLQAAKLAGFRAVPVVIREANPQELLELALVENVQRADLSALETAEAYKQLTHEFDLTQDQIAKRVGKSRVSVTNTLSLLDLSPAVKQALADRKISEGHARALKGLSSQAQSAALQTVLKNELNVRQTEELARKLKGNKSKTPQASKKRLPPEILELQDRLRDSLQTEVKMTYGEKGGTVTLRYYSDEELNTLLERLLGNLD